MLGSLVIRKFQVRVLPGQTAPQPLAARTQAAEPFDLFMALRSAE
ncbi:MAG: hypothetical protein ACJAR2_002205 [Ilumatobacter sp.]|jgi:hypothetical protein